MRIATLLALAALGLASSAAAQQLQAPKPGGPLGGPAVGQLEIKAYQAIPKAKVAVQLTSDTHLSRELRRHVMIRLARRGNEVGFSGGNVMRMNVSYFDLGGSSGGTGGNVAPPSYEAPGSNPRMNLPQNRLERLDPAPPPAGSATLRIGLTLYALDSGKVLWSATASCITQANLAMRAGEAIIDNIFDNADKDRLADAGCPL